MKPDTAEPRMESEKLFTSAVRELVALGAALACNCEPCLRFHYREAKKLGISDEDIRSAFDMAAMVKQTPARKAQELAERLLGSAIEPADGAVHGDRGQAV